MMAILQGRVRISVPSSEGREAVFKIMGEGEIFGEIALLDGKERTADAMTITPCELLVVERRAFLPVLIRRPELCIRPLELLCERLRRTDQQFEDLLVRHFENRLARTLLRLGKEHGLRERGAVRIDLSLSQTELANLAGGTRGYPRDRGGDGSGGRWRRRDVWARVADARQGPRPRSLSKDRGDGRRRRA